MVSHVIDGDTIALANGSRVRLLQIDTPEPGTSECFSRAAGRELRRILPAGARITLEADAPLDLRDRYGRLLRYVHRGGINVNVELARRGAATVWFYDGLRGRYASRLLAAAGDARTARRGLWGACPSAVWDPLGPATTGGAPSPPRSDRSRVAAATPSYPERLHSAGAAAIWTAPMCRTRTSAFVRPTPIASTARATATAARADRLPG